MCSLSSLCRPAETRLVHRSFPAAAACCVIDLLSQGKPHCAEKARRALGGQAATVLARFQALPVVVTAVVAANNKNNNNNNNNNYYYNYNNNQYAEKGICSAAADIGG